ncbi:GlxA family transcriptional regulator [Sphingomonas koreensis]
MGQDSITGAVSAVSRTITFAAFDQVALIDLFGPLEVFVIANGFAGGEVPRYRIDLASLRGGTIAAVGGVRIETVALGEAFATDADTLIVAGSGAVLPEAELAQLVPWLRAHGAAYRRLCSVCTGAVILARAGLLDGRRATTHWAALDTLQREHPGVTVERGPVFVEDRDVWTSAGVTAGIDLALALVERDLGHRIAMAVARTLVVYMRRPGGQPQLSQVLAAQTASDPAFANLLAWIADNLARDLSVARLAEQVGMSIRTFGRLFRQTVGDTPVRTVERMRLRAAADALASGSRSIKDVARATGFGSSQNLRRAFLQHHGVTPGTYRQRHGDAAAIPPFP